LASLAWRKGFKMLSSVNIQSITTEMEKMPLSSSAEDISERLKKLETLKDLGHITGEEYQKKRAEILGEI